MHIAMNYLQWNNAIIKHFFNPEKEEKEVTLYFSEKIIEEIGSYCFPELDGGYVQNFYNALRCGVNGISNNDYIQRILDLEQKSTSGITKIDGVLFNYPPYFTYFLTFILPFTSGNSHKELNANNFYGRVKTFFEEKDLANDYDKTIRNKLNQVDHLWSRISDWLMEDNNFDLGYLEKIEPPDNRKYVQKFEYHILYSKEQEKKLSHMLVDNNILPGEAIGEEGIKKLLIAQGKYLKLSPNTVKKIKENDYIGEKIVKRAFKFYQNWDGAVATTGAQRRYSRNRLVLCLKLKLLKQHFHISYFRIFSKNSLPEDLSLTVANGDTIEQVTPDLWGYSKPLNYSFDYLESSIELRNDANKSKYTWKTKDFIIFKKIPEFDWVEIPKVEYGVGKTLILCKKEFFMQSLKNWFDKIEDTSKKMYNNNSKTTLPDGWIVFFVKDITSFPHEEYPQLTPDKEKKVKINFDKSFYFNGTFYRNQLPKVWLEGTEELDKGIVARYEDDSEISLLQEQDSEQEFINSFSFTEEHIAKQGKFKLMSGEIKFPRLLQIADFTKKDNDAIENLLPKRNPIGQPTNLPKDYVKGLEHLFSSQKVKNSIPYQDKIKELFVNPQEVIPSFDYNTLCYDNHPGNILLHYISTKGKLTKQEFDNAVYTLLKTAEKEKDIKKQINRLRYNLQNLGFIDYNAEKSQIIINKSHLVVIPGQPVLTTLLTGARDQGFMDQIANDTSLEIVPQENPLLPQIIYIKFENECEALDFAQQHNVVFKKGGLYTQFALAHHFDNISNWEQYIHIITDSIKDFEGGQMFDINTLRFVDKPEVVNKKLTLVKFKGINGYKTLWRLWYKGEAYDIKNQQYGIYLYLFLYKRKYNKVKELEANIILYDEQKQYLAVPIYCSLPRFFSISLSLLSGREPTTQYLQTKNIKRKGVYIIYTNVPRIFIKNTVVFKLHQRLVPTNIHLLTHEESNTSI